MSDMNYLYKMSSVEQILIFLFIIFIVAPVEPPESISQLVDSPMGITSIFIVTIFLFFYTNPIIAILYVFVGYELLRRSSKVTGKTAIIKYVPSQQKKDIKMEMMNPPKKETLEEEMVEKLAPIGHSDPIVYATSEYSPMYENIGGASLV